MNFLKCCTVDDINSGKITAPGESDLKGKALEIERVDNLPNEFQGKNQQQQLATLRTFSPNWSFATTATLAKFNDLKARWAKIVETDEELKQFAKTPVRLFLLKNNGWYLGQCVEKDRDNKLYERQGIGHYLDSQGNYFLCCWEKDLEHKFGLHVTPAGDYFLGEFVNGKRVYGEHYSTTEKRTYKGSFDDDQLPYGAGHIYYDNERVYKGMILKGKPHGMGTFTWPNGNYYEGSFMNGKQHGSGDLFVVKTGDAALNESGIEVGKTDKPGKLYKSTVWEEGVLKS